MIPSLLWRPCVPRCTATTPPSRVLRTGIDQAITDILTSTDETKRQELYTFVLTRLHEDAVYIPLTFETNKALYTSASEGGSLRYRPV